MYKLGYLWLKNMYLSNKYLNVNEKKMTRPKSQTKISFSNLFGNWKLTKDNY